LSWSSGFQVPAGRAAQLWTARDREAGRDGAGLTMRTSYRSRVTSVPRVVAGMLRRDVGRETLPLFSTFLIGKVGN